MRRERTGGKDVSSLDSESLKVLHRFRGAGDIGWTKTVVRGWGRGAQGPARVDSPPRVGGDPGQRRRKGRGSGATPVLTVVPPLGVAGHVDAVAVLTVGGTQVVGPDVAEAPAPEVRSTPEIANERPLGHPRRPRRVRDSRPLPTNQGRWSYHGALNPRLCVVRRLQVVSGTRVSGTPVPPTSGVHSSLTSVSSRLPDPSFGPVTLRTPVATRTRPGRHVDRTPDPRLRTPPRRGPHPDPTRGPVRLSDPLVPRVRSRTPPLLQSPDSGDLRRVDLHSKPRFVLPFALSGPEGGVSARVH